jgi:RHS repeat-associated protein
MGCRELDISDCFIFSTEKNHSAAHFEYSPFGKIISDSGSMPEKFAFRFSSEYNDSETGLVYYNYRYYDADMGRWISRDPAEEGLGGQNLYVMVGNNTMMHVDYLGLYWGEGYINKIKDKITGLYEAAKKIWEFKIPKPPNNTDNHANWALMMWDWFYENGSNPINFVKDSNQSKDIAESYSMKQVLKKWCKNKKTPDGWRFTGAGTATGTYGEVEWFLGSYEIKNFNLNDNETKATFTVYNTSGWYSGTRLPQSWQNTIKSTTGYSISALVTDAPRDAVIKTKLQNKFGRFLFDIPGISFLDMLPSFDGNWKQTYDVEMEWCCDKNN